MDQQKQEITLAVAAKIKYFRRINGLSQEELALRANLNPAYYGQVERGLKCPTVDTLYKIAQAMDLSLSELLRIDAFPGYIKEYDQRVHALLARVPSEKLDHVVKIMEDIISLF